MVDLYLRTGAASPNDVALLASVDATVAQAFVGAAEAVTAAEAFDGPVSESIQGAAQAATAAVGLSASVTEAIQGAAEAGTAAVGFVGSAAGAFVGPAESSTAAEQFAGSAAQAMVGSAASASGAEEFAGSGNGAFAGAADSAAASVDNPVPDVSTAVANGASLYIEQKPKPQIRRYVYPWWEDAAEEEARKIAAAAPKLPGEIAPGVLAEAEAKAAEPEQIEAIPAFADDSTADDPQSMADEQSASEAAEALIASVRAAIVAHNAPPPAAEPMAISALMLPDDLFFAPIVTAAPTNLVDDALVMDAIAIIEAIELQECV